MFNLRRYPEDGCGADMRWSSRRRHEGECPLRMVGRCRLTLSKPS